MKKFFLPLFLIPTLGLAQFQPSPQINPFAVNQYTYVDSAYHSVPYAVIYPSTGNVTVVFDPSTSATDMAKAFTHAQKAIGLPSTATTQQAVLPNVVNLNINVQETRTGAPFNVNSSNTGTTLATVPFNNPINLQTNGHYRFVCKLYVLLGSGGSKIDVGGTCNTSNFVAQYWAQGGTTNVYGGQLLSFLSGPAGASNATATEITIEGELDVTNGGTFVIQFAQNAANATNSTVLAGSTLTVIQIP